MIKNILDAVRGFILVEFETGEVYEYYLTRLSPSKKYMLVKRATDVRCVNNSFWLKVPELSSIELLDD
jgi:hypothetical protein